MNQKPPDWNPSGLLEKPIYQQFQHLPLLQRSCRHYRRGLGWPPPEQLQQLIPTGACNAAGKPLGFVAQAEPMTAIDYERSILETGQIPTREQSWHDLFNALMWVSFPQTKSRLNQIHVAEGLDNSRPRSRRRDLATLLDESGVLVASAAPELAEQNRAHRWSEMFVQGRDRWFRLARPLLLGHGLAEQCLKPYLGLTAKAVYLDVTSDFFTLTLEQQLPLLDQIMSLQLDRLGSPKDLMPLPILGIPGWAAENSDPHFYQNQQYFRPKSSPDSRYNG